MHQRQGVTAPARYQQRSAINSDQSTRQHAPHRGAQQEHPWRPRYRGLLHREFRHAATFTRAGLSTTRAHCHRRRLRSANASRVLAAMGIAAAVRMASIPTRAAPAATHRPPAMRVAWALAQVDDARLAFRTTVRFRSHSSQDYRSFLYAVRAECENNQEPRLKLAEHLPTLGHNRGSFHP